MAVSSSSSSRSSSSSYRSSARYSSSYRSEGSGGGVTDPLFEPFLETEVVGPHSLFGEDGDVAPLCLPPFSRHHKDGVPGLTGGTVTGRPASMGVVKSLGDSYSMSADVSHFEAHDVVVMAYNHHIVIHAEKVLENGSVSDTFTHKTLLPEDMDPLSVSATLTPMGMLVVSVRRTQALGGLEPSATPS
ncbi:heat shock protein beta-7-like [Esox lucius]|uniref:heat shock protein beta-7-like n=1 Tax=Esox lucius TaxID=8010 RepID=UPI00147747B9|nr:heat shock protein beta-7-like [Esox lucius]